MPRRKSKPSEEFGGREISINVYQGSYTTPQLQDLRRKLAKRANQRIVRLERASSEITGESFAAFGAVQDAYDYLEHQKAGRKRFREQKGALQDTNELRREITVLQGFLGRKSSLVSGQKDIERQRIETFESGNWGKGNKITGNTRKGIKFASTKEFYDFLNSNAFKGLIASGFTSEQLIERYDTAVEIYNGKQDEVMEQMDKALQDYRAGQKISIKDLEGRLGMRKIT